MFLSFLLECLFLTSTGSLRARLKTLPLLLLTLQPIQYYRNNDDAAVCHMTYLKQRVWYCGGVVDEICGFNISNKLCEGFHSKIHTNYFSNKDKEMKPFVNCLHPFGNSLSTFKNAI